MDHQDFPAKFMDVEFFPTNSGMFERKKRQMLGNKVQLMEIFYILELDASSKLALQ